MIILYKMFSLIHNHNINRNEKRGHCLICYIVDHGVCQKKDMLLHGIPSRASFTTDQKLTLATKQRLLKQLCNRYAKEGESGG